MIRCVILDLDGTLVDTSALASLREQRQWKQIPTYFNKCKLYDTAVDVINSARAADLKIAIVTNSPSTYARGILAYFDIKIDYLVAYHDVKEHKPSPEGVQKVLSHFNLQPGNAVFLGDSIEDSQAASAANVQFYSVNWAKSFEADKQALSVSNLLELFSVGNRGLVPGNRRTHLIQNGSHFFLGYYLTGLKYEVWAFKEGKEKAISGWISKTIELSSQFPEIQYIVRARGHQEITKGASEVTPLDRLAGALANVLDAQYVPEMLVKTQVLKKSVACSAEERKRQVRGVYEFKSDLTRDEGNQANFLVVDDVLTSGATTTEIMRAIRAVYPEAKIFLFTIVKTLYRSVEGEATAESQHNTQLLADLRTPVETTPPEDSSLIERESRASNRHNLVAKSFSANYARTNNNFIVHNLKTYSIAAEPSSKKILQASLVIKNMLQRGVPTIASRRLRERFNCRQDVCTQEPIALLSNKPVQWKRLIRGDVKAGYYPARKFYEELLGKHLGEYGFIKQLTVPEVEIFDMTQVHVDRFKNRQVDFYIPHVGVIIEIDGSQHADTATSDMMRDEFTETMGIKTFRFTVSEVERESGSFLDKMAALRDYIGTIDQLEQDGIIAPPHGITLRDYKFSFDSGVDTSAPSIRLTASIRFQIILIELILRGQIRFNKKNKITLINRDKIDFAQEAVEDLSEYFRELLILLGAPDNALDIEVTETNGNSSNDHSERLRIDFSIFERFDDTFQTDIGGIIARTHYFDFYRKFSSGSVGDIESFKLEAYDFFEMSCVQPIHYDLDLSPDSRQRQALRFFLANLFLPFLSEPDFREGQVGIIGAALARKGTIGLLPTGSGKSICYQLSAILQPAISFVVCPIKSLMYDQKSDLDAIGFTRCNYITGDLSADEKAKVQNEFGRGKYFFVFISPERFQTRKFRNEMTAIGLDRDFAYAVIDEVHCLSEWGHDFRTSYLNLSRAIEKLAPRASYIGLTATASVNVLKDIQTEFKISDENVRTPLDFTRKELAFHVIDDGGRKTDEALQLVKLMQERWDGVADIAGIIFTPTVNGAKGCFPLAGALSSSLGQDVRFYSGSNPKGFRSSEAEFDQYKQEVQRDFKASKYSLLAATKAFGMGVNKGNVGYTIHFGIPGSMEALYQEAGRAGRDKSLFQEESANCYVLLTRETNVQALDAIWDTSTTVDGLKENVKKLNRNSDVNTNLFLMTNSLESINSELRLVTSIFKYLKEQLPSSKIVLAAKLFGVQKFHFEKAIYRLSQLGIVKDWLVEDFFTGKLEVEFVCPEDKELRLGLEQTIRKYEPSFSFNDLFESSNDFMRVANQRLAQGRLDETTYIFLVLLIWSYDHFVYNRRQSLKTVYEQCCDLSTGRISEEEFKTRLENYFRFDDSTHRLHMIAEDAEKLGSWLTIFYEEDAETKVLKLISQEKLRELKEQVARYLESYKDNPFLNYTSGLLRLSLGQFDDADGERRMKKALEKISTKAFVEIEMLILETLNLKPLLSSEAQSQYARTMYEAFPRRQTLEIINRSFQDPYTYQELLSPLVKKLEGVLANYREVSW